MNKFIPHLLVIWGVYYFLFGAWSIVHLPSFLKIVQYPADPFKTAINGLLFAALGSVYVYSGMTRQLLIPAAILAGLVAISVGIITASFLDDIGNPMTFRLESIIEIIVGVIFLVLALPKHASNSSQT